MQNLYDEEPSLDLKKNGFIIDENFKHDISVATLSITDEKKSKKLNKEIGEYVIINSPLLNFKKSSILPTQKILNEFIGKFISKKPKKILIVGLGNQDIVADAFGSLCVDNLTLNENIFAIKPNVYANTNIMSFDIVKGVCNQIKPNMVIVLDSLGTSNIKRLACSFQICDVGILPGGALHGQNKIISSRTLNIPCVVIGVPLMIFCKGLNSNLEKFYQDLILTPKDIEVMVTRCALMVCKAINHFVN